jgi:5-methyltetrahydropteroyltriglutamate--homocysteine methyltransferase
MHTDHVGSLLRPAAVLRAREGYASGRLTLDALREAEDAAIVHALDLQREVGLEIFTDGEIRRDAWMTGVAEAVDGFVEQHRMMTWHLPDGSTLQEPSRGKVVASRLHQTTRITGYEMSFLSKHAPGPVKMTMPSPIAIANGSFTAGVSDAAYPSREALLKELVGIMRGEMLALVDDGVAYVQLDEGFAGYVQQFWYDTATTEKTTDPLDRLADDIAAENACLDVLPQGGVIRAAHICRGNSKSRWTATGSYDHVAERLFSDLHVDRFLLEYDSQRAGGFEPLRFVPKGKTVVLGLVSTKSAYLESQDDLLRRIDEAAKYVPADQLALSPQCGFASVSEGNLLSEDDQRHKLELVVDTARLAWG